MNNIVSYNSEMRKSMMDKAFFIDKIDADIIVDYGCADGALLSFLQTQFPEIVYIGFDNSNEELQLAANNTTALLTSDWNTIVDFLGNYPEKKKAVVASSLIHEVYSYSTRKDIDQFWARLYSGMFDNVVIRDMSVSRTSSRPSDVISVAKIRQLADKDQLHEYEEEWGSINENWSLIHFLLKYRYTVNWDREVKENYLPLSYEKLIGGIPSTYTPIYSEHFTLPFIRRKVLADFGVDLQDRTHVKLILEKK